MHNIEWIYIPRINIENYPDIKQHLDKYSDKLNSRYDKWDTKYNLRNCAYLEDFEKHKIVFQEIVREPSFFLDKDRFYGEASTFSITWNNLEYLIALLNSKFTWWAFKKFYMWGWLWNDWFRYKKKFLVKLPIPIISEEKQKPFIELVNKILEMTKQSFYDPKNPPKEQLDLESNIDDMVYELYGLSEEEINVVEESLKVA